MNLAQGEEKNGRIKPETINGLIYWEDFFQEQDSGGKRNAPYGIVISDCSAFPGCLFPARGILVIAGISCKWKR